MKKLIIILNELLLVAIVVSIATALMLIAFDVVYGQENYIDPLSTYSKDGGEESTEIKFRLNKHVKLKGDKGWALTGDFNMKCFWDYYNKQNSRPFRTGACNYNPEAAILTPKLGSYRFGLVYAHESNGGEPEVTRSWDRVIVDTYYNFGSISTVLRLWNVFMTEHEEIIDISGPGELTIQRIWSAPILGRVNSLLRLSKANQMLKLSWPTLWLDNSQYAVTWERNKIDSLLDLGVEVERFGIGLVFNPEK